MAMEKRATRSKGKKQKESSPLKWTVLSWMIDKGVVRENQKIWYRRTEQKLGGVIKRDGIRCDGCHDVVPVNEFPLHAGRAMHSRPFKRMHGEQGYSLMACQKNAWEMYQREHAEQMREAKGGDGGDPNDDECLVCGDGGNLMCCSGCPSSFHKKCLRMKVVPEGAYWYCKKCFCKYCGSRSTSSKETSIRELLNCSQCTDKFHVECRAKLRLIDSNKFFCGQNCADMFQKLQKLVGRRKELEKGLYWTFIHPFYDVKTDSESKKIECNSKVAIALELMRKRFVSSDKKGTIDLIEETVYNSGPEFNRFYMCILEKNDEIVSVAILRMNGPHFAELPFICTREEVNDEGMCHRLMMGITMTLLKLNVARIILSSMNSLKNVWIKKFMFEKLEATEEEVIRPKILALQDTILLQKKLTKKMV